MWHASLIEFEAVSFHCQKSDKYVLKAFILKTFHTTTTTTITTTSELQSLEWVLWKEIQHPAIRQAASISSTGWWSKAFNDNEPPSRPPRFISRNILRTTWHHVFVSIITTESSTQMKWQTREFVVCRLNKSRVADLIFFVFSCSHTFSDCSATIF